MNLEDMIDPEIYRLATSSTNPRIRNYLVIYEQECQFYDPLTDGSLEEMVKRIESHLVDIMLTNYILRLRKEKIVSILRSMIENDYKMKIGNHEIDPMVLLNRWNLYNPESKLSI